MNFEDFIYRSHPEIAMHADYVECISAQKVYISLFWCKWFWNVFLDKLPQQCRSTAYRSGDTA